MAKTISGFFRTRKEGEAAQDALVANGFTRNEVSFVAGDSRGHETPAVGPVYETGSESEAAADAWMGGAAGLAAGVILAVIPGIGPILAAGPIAAAIGGLAVGAATGGVIGLLRDHGVSEEEAEFYAEGVRRGGAVVVIHDLSDERADNARKILEKAGSIHVEDLGAELARSGWHGRVRKAG